MDPIMKLLEEDEDETMHSGADVDALTAALNRDIEGHSSASQCVHSNSNAAVMSQGMNQSQFFHQWQNSSQEGQINQQIQPDENSLPQEQPASADQKQPFTISDSKQQHNKDASRSQEGSQLTQQPKQEDIIDQSILQPPEQVQLQIPETSTQRIHESSRTPHGEVDPQISKIQHMNQQATTSEQVSNTVNKGKQVPFALLLPVITPQLDKERAMQLNSLYAKLKRNEIPKDGFVRRIRSIVGDQMLKMAVMQLQAQLDQVTCQDGVRSSQPAATQYQLQSTVSAKQAKLSMSSASTPKFGDSQTFAQAQQHGHSTSADPLHTGSSSGHVQAFSSYSTTSSTSQKSQDDHQSDSHGMQPNQIVSSALNPVIHERERFARLQGLTKQQQQHLHFSSASFPVYGTSSGNSNHYAGVTSTSSTAVKPQPQDQLMRQAPPNQLPSSIQTTRVTGISKFDRAHSANDANRMHGGSFPHTNSVQHHSASWQSGTISDHVPSSIVKQEPSDKGNEQQQRSQSLVAHGMSSSENKSGIVPGTLKDDAKEKETGLMAFPTPTLSPISVSPSLSTQRDSQIMSNSRFPSAVLPAGNSARSISKKPIIGQKKPLETSLPPSSSKKQKVSGGFLDQSIEQLNDVTAISGVNLREEEEHLFSGPKEDSRVSEASRRVVQEEEERLILQRVPLQKKLEGIMVKSGVRNISNDVVRCLSLCVEERMRGLIRNLIRLSKQRIDIEKSKHCTNITSDVRQQIMLMNQKSKEEWDKKQAEIEKLKKMNDPESNAATDGDKEKEEDRGKASKANKEEDDKMRTTAANVAARAAVGGDDMLSKWQLMAEQARQKREGSSDAVVSNSQSTRDVNHRATSLSGITAIESQDAEKKGHSGGLTASGPFRKGGRVQSTTPLTRERSITLKDVIAVLEKEQQMSKSSLLYGLHTKVSNADVPAEQAGAV